MAWWEASTTADPAEDAALERACARLGILYAEVPAWLRAMACAPAYLQDVSANLSRHVRADGPLRARERLVLAAVLAATSGGGAEVAASLGAWAVEAGATREALVDGVAVAATMAGMNAYYKRAGGGDAAGGEARSGLRASALVNPATGEALREVICVVVSARNGCAPCVARHTRDALAVGVTPAQLDDGARVGAIVASICSFTQAMG